MVFLLLNLFYSFTEGVQWLFQRKVLFSNVSERVQLFPGGGVQMLISIETHITCSFPGGGGGGTSYPPSGSAHGIYQGLAWKHGKGLPNFNRQMVFSIQL